MSTADVALAAAVKMVQVRNEVDSLTRQIRESLDRCPGVVDAAHEDDSLNALLMPATEPHLRVYYRHTVAAGQAGYSGKVKGADEFLACPHCVAADKLIQQRKEARRRLGRARGTLTLIARDHMNGIR